MSNDLLYYSEQNRKLFQFSINISFHYIPAKQCRRPVPIHDSCMLQRISSTLGTGLCIADRSMARTVFTQTNIAHSKTDRKRYRRQDPKQ